MAYAAVRMFQGALTTTLTTTLATVPSGKTWIVQDIQITNTGASVRRVTLAMPGSGAAHQIFGALRCAPHSTTSWDGHIVLAAAETITGGQDTGTDVTLTISGAEG